MSKLPGRDEFIANQRAKEAARSPAAGVELSGHALEELFFAWSEYTAEIGEAISRKNIDGFVSELRRIIAAGGDGRKVEWISVDDKFPEAGQTVAFVIDCKSATFGYLHGRVLGGHFSYVGQMPTFSVPGLGLSASHWMPLPEEPAVLNTAARTTDSGTDSGKKS